MSTAPFIALTLENARLFRQVRRLEAQYRLVTESLHDAVYLVEPAGYITFANAALVHLTGYARDELLGRLSTDLYAPHLRPLLLQRRQRALRGEVVPPYLEAELLRNDGVRVPVELSTANFVVDREIVGRIVVVRDITTHKHAEAALRRAHDALEYQVDVRTAALAERARLATLTAAVAMALTSADALREVLHRCTKALVQHLEVASAHLWTLHHDEHRLELHASAGLTTPFDGTPSRMPVDACTLGRIVQERHAYLTNTLCEDPRVPEQVWATREGLIAFAGYPLLVAGQVVGIMAVFARAPLGEAVRETLAAVADQIALGIERKHLETHLRQTQKMEAIGTLAGGIAHDFNNILSAILSYTELTRDTLPPDSQGWGNLQQVLAAGQRAKELVHQILTFSRRTEPERQPVQLHHLVQEVLTLLRAALPSTITLRATMEEQTGTALANATQIHQVLLNLCTNAAHAMRETGGMLEVRLDACEVTADRTTIATPLAPGPYLRLAVQDTGHGMPPEVMEHIFEPFFTTKSAGEGTGLGLAVAHGIVAAHSGAMTVTSTLGQGTTFEVYLPRSDRCSVAAGGPGEPSPTGSARILFVDDEESLAQLGQMALVSLGYEVVSHTSSRAALDAFRTAPAGFDLVITDYTMPHLTGEDLVREVRRIRPDIPIILCTGFNPTMTAEHAATLGINALCPKPLSLRDLGVAIRRVLAQRTTSRVEHENARGPTKGNV